ncbi:MAG: response regulator transcription factor [Bacteroidia bacterium]|nr:response regulator transcription factor [Bacteroidia bacterium]
MKTLVKELTSVKSAVIKEPKTTKKMVRIMIVDDHLLVGQSLETLIHKREGYQVIKCVSSGKEAIAYLEKADPKDFPDVVLMDLFMNEDSDSKEPDGMRAARYIFKNICSSKVYDIRVIIVSVSLNGLYISSAHNMSIQGYLAKESPAPEIFEAIDTVMKGEMYYRGKVYSEMSRYIQSNKCTDEEIIPPSPMEQEILKMTSEGLSAREISEKRGMTVDGVEGHKRQLLRKLNAKNVAELISQAYKYGFLKLY